MYGECIISDPFRVPMVGTGTRKGGILTGAIKPFAGLEWSILAYSLKA